MKVKQKIIQAGSSQDFGAALNAALQMGWFVHCMAVNSQTNAWVAVLQMEVAS